MEKLLNKIKNIIIGWYKVFFKSQSILSKKRIEICKTCPHCEKIMGQRTCTLCFCPIISKSEVANETCYDGRWDDIKINEYDK